MVKIRKLEIQGFKSFAKKTEIPIPSGFNTICGPNGSGKSNIIDAITFVIGTLSTKQIRAGKLEDLVFNGSKDYEARDEAKVTIEFDNDSGELPIDDDIVTVTRKINTKGNSIYKLNGKTVTRKKIIDVLSTARIYPDGHNIIMQGAITKFIEMSPKQRREIIDEASGIAEFDQKKKESERELEKVTSKLKQAGLILSERKKALEKLEEEKKRARKKERLTEDLNNIKIKIIKLKLKSEKQKEIDTNKKIDELETEVEKLEEEIKEKDEKIDAKEQEKDEIRDEIIDENKDKELIKKIESVKSQIQSKKEKIDDKRDEIKRLENSIEKLKRLEKESQRITGKGPAKDILKLDKKGVYGTIGTLGKVEEEYQKAMEIATGSNINSLVVDSADVAKECIEYLKKNKSGRATFLPLDKLRRWRKSKESKQLKNKPGFIDYAINLIDFDDKYKIAFNHVFKDTLIVKDLNIAKRHAGKAQMVTLDGQIVYKSGAMRGGHYKTKKSFGSFKESKSSEIDELKTEKETLKTEITEIQQSIGQLSQELDELRQKENETEDELGHLEEKIGDIDEEIKETKEARKEIFEEKITKKQKLNELQVKQAKIETRLDDIKMEFERFEEIEGMELDDIDDIEEPEEDKSISVLEQEKRDIARKLERMGPVNQKALEEYDIQKQVYDDLKKRVDKIKEEKDSILNTVKNIEKRRQEKFMDAFNEINENFKEIFKDLYGYEGCIKLEEEGNIKSGLLIEANTSNKNSTSLDAMSGGEKTLTALAFLFSVQLYQPAPFYILDEIDAALDQSNSRKVADLIDDYSEEAQFVVISHNDETLKKSDYVYGVSMTDGVSEVMALEMPDN